MVQPDFCLRLGEEAIATLFITITCKWRKNEIDSQQSATYWSVLLPTCASPTAHHPVPLLLVQVHNYDGLVSFPASPVLHLKSWKIITPPAANIGRDHAYSKFFVTVDTKGGPKQPPKVYLLGNMVKPNFFAEFAQGYCKLLLLH